ncbi:MAG TPA: diaminohydroxyphosphoribosylaminopyrimidine deaminase, partial [Alcanivorax sp.]|nr:diaminohydroxyphosphoribosylaminopyrimidine deaminase [Alcanivorax sp.]
MQIDTSTPVMVTGATGYVAGRLVERLLEEGVTVHAAVRNPDDSHKLQYLNAIAEKTPGSIRYFKADLLSPGSYAEAMAGCSV